MTAAIHQPNFMPWVGYFHKIVQSDAFVLFDDVQLPRGKSLVNRVKINLAGKEHWLTIPVSGKGDLLAIKDVRIANQKALPKLLKTISLTYKKAPFFEETFKLIEGPLSGEHELLCDLNIDLISNLAGALSPKTKLFRSSELDCQLANTNEKILCLLEKIGADQYISGAGSGSKRYIDEEEYQLKNIRLIWQIFEHPIYPQTGADEFMPKMSIIDMMFSLGVDETRRTLETMKLT